MSEAIIAKKAAIVDEVSEKFTAAASRSCLRKRVTSSTVNPR